MRSLAGHATVPEALPVTDRLQAAFGQRIERLPEPTRAALLIAAAEEAGELAVILRAAAELGLPADAFDPAEEAGLVRTAGAALSFRHPLVRSVIYESAPLGRRRRAHAALAVALEHAHQGERAIWHRAMATSTTDEEVADALEASGRRSQRRGGHASAATAFERAATLSESTPPRARRLAAAVEAAWFAAQVDRALELVSRSLPLSERAQRAGLLYWRGAIEGQSGGLLDGVATLHQAAALSEDPSLTLKILRDGCAMADQADAPDEALSVAERAADASCVDEIDRFTKASLTARAADLSGDYARGKALAAELVELAEQIDVPVCLIWCHARGNPCWDGRSQSAPCQPRRPPRPRYRRGHDTPFLPPRASDGADRHSRFDLAYATAEEGWRLALETGQPWAAGWNVIHLALIDALRGLEERVQAHVAELQALVARSGATSTGHYAERVMGLLDLGLGRPADATERLLRAFSMGVETPTRRSFLTCPMRLRRRRAPIGSTRSPANSRGSRSGRDARPIRKRSRCSRAAGHWSTSRTPNSTTSKPSPLPTACHRSTKRAPSFCTANGCVGSADASMPAATCGPHSNCSGEWGFHPGRRAPRSNCTPAARPHVSAIRPPATS